MWRRTLKPSTSTPLLHENRVINRRRLTAGRLDVGDDMVIVARGSFALRMTAATIQRGLRCLPRRPLIEARGRSTSSSCAACSVAPTSRLWTPGIASSVTDRAVESGVGLYRWFTLRLTAPGRCTGFSPSLPASWWRTTHFVDVALPRAAGRNYGFLQAGVNGKTTFRHYRDYVQAICWCFIPLRVLAHCRYAAAS